MYTPGAARSACGAAGRVIGRVLHKLFGPKLFFLNQTVGLAFVRGVNDHEEGARARQLP